MRYPYLAKTLFQNENENVKLSSLEAFLPLAEAEARYLVRRLGVIAHAMFA